MNRLKDWPLTETLLFLLLVVSVLNLFELNDIETRLIQVRAAISDLR